MNDTHITVTVFGNTLAEIGRKADPILAAFFGTDPFEIVEMDISPVGQLMGSGDVVGWKAQVRAELS